MAQEIYHRSEWGNPNEQWGNVYLNADLTNELYKRASEYENSWVTDQLLNGVGTKPSIIMTPTAYEDNKLNSVKPSDGNADFDFTRGSSATRVNELGLVQDVTDTDLPRINYTNFDYENGEVVPYSGEGSLLLEPQSTNLVTYSEDFSQWAINDLTLESGYLAPDGSTNAYKVTRTGTSAYIVQSGGVSGNDARTIYARTVSGTGNVKLLSHNTNTNNTFTITEQWQRFELNSTPSVGSNFYAIDFRGAASTLTELIIWGTQSEALSYATSYIPTSGSTVTRLADVCNNAGSSDLINSTEGVLYAEIAALADDNTFRSISINANDTRDDQVMIRYRTTSNVISFFIRSGGSVTLNQNVIVQDITKYNKVALKYKNGGISAWINGVEYITSTAAGMPSGLSKIGFQLEDPNVDPFFGNAKCVAVFKEALSDEELQKLTTI